MKTKCLKCLASCPLDGWLVGWLTGWLAGWLVGWLAGWSVDVSFVYLRKIGPHQDDASATPMSTHRGSFGAPPLQKLMSKIAVKM